MLTAAPQIGVSAPRSRRVFLCAVVALVNLVSCASASAALNLTGTWSAVYHCEVGACAGTEISATDSLTQAEGSEVVSGSNRIETVSGTLKGNAFEYRSTVAGYEAKGTFTVGPNGQSWSGPLEDSNGTKGTYTATRDVPPAGSLSQLAGPFNCIGEEGFHQPEIDCGTLLPKGATDEAYEAQVSPDGKNVYSVAVLGDLVEYSRNSANGALTEIGCVTSGTESCAPSNASTGAPGMANPAAIALSPDGKNAYVITKGGNALVEFSRSAETGLLTEIGCVDEANVQCGSHEAKGIANPYDVTVSPDGEDVYVTSFEKESVAEFSRNSATGELTQLPSPNNCISSLTTAETGCGVEKALGLEHVIGLVTTPDGKDLYTAAGGTEGKGAIAAFRREPGGALKQLEGGQGCISTSDRECATALAINGPEDLVVSPDSRNVYVNSNQNNAVLEFQRESSGALTQLPAPNVCIMNGPAEAGCSEAKGLKSTLGVAISPGGENVYASSSEEDDEAVFTRDPETGDLTQFAAPFECVGKIEHTSCEITDVKGIAGARRVTVSPDGKNLYVAGQNDHTVVELARTVPPPVGPPAPETAAMSPAPFVTPIISVPPLVVPPPVLAHTGNVAPVSGTVLVKLPGTSKFVALSSLRQVPFGSVIEATNGIVSVTTAEPGGKTQTGSSSRASSSSGRVPTGS